MTGVGRNWSSSDWITFGAIRYDREDGEYLLKADAGGYEGLKVTIFGTLNFHSSIGFWSFIMFFPKDGLPPPQGGT